MNWTTIPDPDDDPKSAESRGARRPRRAAASPRRRSRAPRTPIDPNSVVSEGAPAPLTV